MKRGDYITCPTCKGKGKVFNHADGIFTFGFAYLFGKDKKDKNNNEIYEGDIVTTNKDDFFAIEYREEEASFKMIDYGIAPFERDIRELTKKGINEQRIKVVGNIHDNPKR